MSRDSTTRLPKTLCPYCGYLLDAASDPKRGRRPSCGDVSICLHCAGVLMFDERLVPIAPTPHALEAVYREQPHLRKQLEHYQKAALALRRNTPNQPLRKH